MEVLKRSEAENGNQIQLVYDKYDQRRPYKICFKTADEYNYRYDSATESYLEASERFNQMKGV